MVRKTLLHFQASATVGDRQLPHDKAHLQQKPWASRGEIPELTEAQARHIVDQMKPIIDVSFFCGLDFIRRAGPFFFHCPR